MRSQGHLERGGVAIVLMHGQDDCEKKLNIDWVTLQEDKFSDKFDNDWLPAMIFDVDLTAHTYGRLWVGKAVDGAALEMSARNVEACDEVGRIAEPSLEVLSNTMWKQTQQRMGTAGSTRTRTHQDRRSQNRDKVDIH